MGWLIALAVLVFLIVLPLGIGLSYHADGLLVRVTVGPIRMQVYPSRKKKEKKPDKPKKDKKKASSPKDPKTDSGGEKEKKGGSITDFWPLVQLLLDFLGELRRKLRISRLNAKVILGGGDPCDLAVQYGRAWMALSNLVPLLEMAFKIKKKDLGVACDFTADQTTILADMDVTITFGRICSLLVRYGIRGLREWLKIKNKREGGALK